MKNYLYISDSGDGHNNLAVDRFILEQYRSGILKGVTLYFYVNDNAVIIGRNQNAWRECNIKAMDDDGVQLVRRHTGGGAVYHDRGNLNFSFITNESHYSVCRQLGVIVRACESLGIHAEKSGRNDVLVNGRKFSGNAFALEGKARGHHGTLLINTDLSKLSGYLNVSKQKLQAKGVASVSSRVCNLSELCSVTVEEMREAVISSFVEEYGSIQPLRFSKTDIEQIERMRALQASWEWRFGTAPAFDHIIETKLDSGEIQLHLKLKNGIIKEAAVYTDALDCGASDEIRALVLGSRLDSDELCSRLTGGSRIANQLAEFIRTKGVQNNGIDQ